MKLVITGANGQLGKALESVGRGSNKYTVTTLSKKELDVTNPSAVASTLYKLQPDVIIHAAAYTHVDGCEGNEQKAYQVNAHGAHHVAQAAEKMGASLVYISSDYVFDGEKETPYEENDLPNPKSIYGKSKWQGEQFVANTLHQAYIVRTSWLYGKGGNNFVRTMLKMALANKEVSVVTDQIGSPTYVNDLANTIFTLLGKNYGTYHVTNSGSCSWYTFAKAIFDEANCSSSLVKPVSTKEYTSETPRPAYSVLEKKALAAEGIQPLRHWKDALREFVREELAIHD